ncbi:carbohydrate binding [Porites harrisoni]
MFPVLLQLYLAIWCASVQSEKHPIQDAQDGDDLSEKLLMQTLQGVHKSLAPCPSGWTQFNSFCYLVESTIKTWHQAQAYCKGLGGELVKINSFEENEFVLKLVKKQAPSLNQAWIGLKWSPRFNGFIWSDNSIPVFKYWARFEPNGNAREPCGHMWTGLSSHLPIRASGLWNDLPCGITPALPCGLVCKRLP